MISHQGTTKDTHSVLYRLRDEGLDVDRVSLAQIIAGNLEVVNTNTSKDRGSLPGLLLVLRIPKNLLIFL